MTNSSLIFLASPLIGVVIIVAFIVALRRQREVLEAARSDALKTANSLNYILKGTNVGTWEWNVQTGETRFNARWAEMIGYSLDEISPTTIETWMGFANPDDLRDSEAALQAHFDGESEFYELEARMKHKDGHWVWVLDRGQVATWSPDGRPEWMYGTHQDVTDRKTLEMNLVARTAEAEKALRVKSEFLAAMSHEIRTPMNGVLGLASLALRESDEFKRQDYIQGIQRSGKLLMGILNDILDFSRLEAGRTRLLLEGFQVRSLLEECIELFAASANSKGIELSLEIADTVPSNLFGDPIKIAQMINNYLGNAIKFTSRGSVTLQVSAKPVNDKYQVLFECKDTGIGIPDDAVNELFKPFSQLKRDSRVHARGTGLGLVLVSEYAKLMNGQCGVQSKPGRGSVFWFEVMLNKAEEINNLNNRMVAIDPTLLAGTHVLIVEDNSMNVLVLEAMLDQYLISHDVATNGVEAIRAFELSLKPGQRPYGAILMDVQMPDMDGVEATRIIKSHPTKAPPIIGLTAAVLPEEITRFKRAGMDTVVAKPIDTKELFSALLTWTGASKTSHNTDSL